MDTPERMRAPSEVTATGYSFLASDATGFPRALPPVRKIGLGRRALAGLMPCSKVLEGGIAKFESSLERDFFVLLEFNGDVLRWDPQPVRIPVETTGRDYVPDVLVTFVPEPGANESKRTLYEVKYRDDLKKHWKDYHPRLRAARRYARSQGWDFKIITEKEIRGSGLLWNAKFLLPYGYDDPQESCQILLRTSLRRLGVGTPKTVLEASSADQWEQALLLSSLWSMVSDGSIGADLTQRLTMDSEIWLND